MAFKDLTGQKFGRLTVIERMENTKHGSARWKCQCECGSFAAVITSNLTRGNTSSCGCLSKEQKSKPRKKSIISELEGRRFGRWTVLGKSEKRGKRIFWLCRCECGNEKMVDGYSLLKGDSLSCGCLMVDRIKETCQKHGMRKTRLYTVWVDMRNRCSNPQNISYQWYGAKGIAVCPEWLGEHGFENFSKWAYENGYDETAERGKCTLDRKDSNGNYEPSNCQWKNSIEQNNNRSSNYIIEYLGEKKTLAEWCRELNMPYKAVHDRIKRYGWDIDKAFTTPVITRK